MPPPTVDKEAPPSDILKSSGKTPLEAGCICIFECKPTSSECQSCVYCRDQFQSEEVSPPTVPNVAKSPSAGKKPISKVVHSFADLKSSASVQPVSDVTMAVRDSVRPMIGMAIKVGNFYGLNLRPGIENKANGNCAIETCMDQLNFRPEFEQKRVLGEPQHLSLIHI